MLCSILNVVLTKNNIFSSRKLDNLSVIWNQKLKLIIIIIIIRTLFQEGNTISTDKPLISLVALNMDARYVLQLISTLDISDLFYTLYVILSILLSYQPIVTVTSCFVYSC